MEKKVYDKLVRDNIPQIIRGKGLMPVVHIASKEEYNHKLMQKLQEEVDEYLRDKDAQELADILEVIYAIAKSHRLSPHQLETMRAKKVKERGAFDLRIILEKVEKDFPSTKSGA